MYSVKLKFLRRETVLRQILKTKEKNQKNRCGQKICGSSTVPQGKDKLTWLRY